MTHLGYTSEFCFRCKDYTSHRMLEYHSTTGKAEIIKICCKHIPERGYSADTTLQSPSQPQSTSLVKAQVAH